MDQELEVPSKQGVITSVLIKQTPCSKDRCHIIYFAVLLYDSRPLVDKPRNDYNEIRVTSESENVLTAGGEDEHKSDNQRG